MAIPTESAPRNLKVNENPPILGPYKTHLTWIEVNQPEDLNNPYLHRSGVALFFDRDAHRARQAESWPFPKKQIK